MAIYLTELKVTKVKTVGMDATSITVETTATEVVEVAPTAFAAKHLTNAEVVEAATTDVISTAMEVIGAYVVEVTPMIVVAVDPNVLELTEIATVNMDVEVIATSSGVEVTAWKVQR